MRSKTPPWAIALLGLLVGAFACEGKYRPYSLPQGGPDATSITAPDAPSTLTPEVSQPALRPAPGVSPAEVIGNGGRLPQQAENPSNPESNPTTPSDAGAPTDAAAATPMASADPNDPLCCLDDCDNTGQQQCDPEPGGDQTPTLPAGAACGTPGAVACGSGLACKACNGGGNQCTPVAQCCGGCPGNQICNGGTCGCTAQQIDCGGGLCIPNAANMCCPAMPGCSSARPFCDNRDNT
jgi:hypothetical protein